MAAAHYAVSLVGSVGIVESEDERAALAGREAEREQHIQRFTQSRAALLHVFLYMALTTCRVTVSAC
jgi:hypothetical protein